MTTSPEIAADCGRPRLRRAWEAIRRTCSSVGSVYSWSADRKVIVLGCCLLLSCVVVAAIGIRGVLTTQWSGEQVRHHTGPGLRALLDLDRDLSQAELFWERGERDRDDANARSADFKSFSDALGRGGLDFATYKRLAIAGDEEVASIAAYELARGEWLHTTIDPSGAGVDAARAAFDAMRERLVHVIEVHYRPTVEGAADRADLASMNTVIELAVGGVVALLLGVTLTRKMARLLRAQHRASDAANLEIERQNRRQGFEARLGRALDMAQDEPATLRLVEDAIRQAAPDVVAEVLLADSSRAHVHLAATTDPARGGPCCGVLKPSDCPAVRRGHLLSFSSGGAFDACPHLKQRPGGDRSAVCIPLSVMGQTVGVLHATAPDRQLPSAEHVQSLELIASKSGERLGMLRAFRKTEAQASCDPLTGLMNRRSLEEKVHELGREQTPFAVAYGDLDHFKSLNDTYGHETGDKALRTFAQVLKASSRPGDLPARWGGEEFVLVLPNASAADAVGALDRIRAALAKALRGAATPAFTVSFGVAQSSEGSLFVDVLDRADAALLRAKREGRNRTIAADATPLPAPAIDVSAAPRVEDRGAPDERPRNAVGAVDCSRAEAA